MTKIKKDDLLDDLREGLSDIEIAEKRGMSPTTVSYRRRQLVRSGFSPEHDWQHTVPDGYAIKGVSTLYNKDGGVVQQWVKSTVDHQRQLDIIREIVESMKGDIPRAEPVPVPTHAFGQNLLALYVLTDYHLGLLAWGEESGEDWDVKIAEDLVTRYFETAIQMSPACDVAVLGQLGDFLHWDGLDAVTPTSGHVLDADTRFEKLVRVAIRTLRRIIGTLLSKHGKVHVICAEGNHDIASSIWLREMLNVFYEDDPRVTVDINPDPYYCVQHGKTTLFFHHGHKARPGQVDTIFASKFRKEYGESLHSYAHLGHLHHAHTKESPLMVVEQHRTLAAHDAYASRGGYLSGRSAPVIVYHKEFGEVSRITLSPEMVK